MAAPPPTRGLVRETKSNALKTAAPLGLAASRGKVLRATMDLIAEESVSGRKGGK